MASERRALVEGSARGTALRLDEPLSFWGGLDPASGLVIDTHHPQQGESLADTILVMPYGRGSSSSSQVLTEALRLGNGPAAIVLGEPDQIIALGAFASHLLYDISCPVVVVNAEAYDSLATGSDVVIEASPDGRVEIDAR